MPLGKSIFNEGGFISVIKCHVCTIIERKEIFLVIKWFLKKNTSKKKGLMVSGSWMKNVCM
jgi:hypothetical protein